MTAAPTLEHDVVEDYLTVVTSAILLHPRSLQKKIGPSEIGHPCARRIAYKLLDQPENDQRPNWKATVGTGVHLWMEGAFAADNARLVEAGLPPRWLIEDKVSVGEVALELITGHTDVYDTWTHTVIDHKTCGPTMLKRYRKNGAGKQYRAQAHMYGRGWVRRGCPVADVMIAFLPRQGELEDAYVFKEAYDEQLALDALERLWGIQIAVDQLGPRALAVLPTAEHWCTQCPYFRFRSTDLTKGCPGDPTSPSNRKPNRSQFEGLI